MEEELVQSLRDIGYDGLLLDTIKLSQALEKGTKSIDFTGLVAWLAEQLVIFGNIEEHVHPTTCPEDSSTFLLELSSFLKESGCINSQLVSGNVNQRLATKQERILLLDYLIVELMACKIVKFKKPDTAKLELTIHESDTAKSLKEMLIAIQISKPPEDITIEQLFNKIEEKLKALVSKAPSDFLGKPLIIGELSNSQWDKLDQLQNDMKEEYEVRREMLLKRLDVTVQSFLWSQNLKWKDQINESYRRRRDLMTTEPSVTISQLLAARDDVAIIEKTSSASVRKNTKSKFTKVIIGAVPDRGGRAHEQAPPPPEMPSWQKDRAPDSGRGGGRGGSGFGGGRGGGGFGGDRGGRGGGGRGFHKDANTNFGQNRDWQDNSQGGSHYQHDDRGNYQRGGGGGGGGGYNRGRGGRVQGGWSQGGSGYQRGGNRSHY